MVRQQTNPTINGIAASTIEVSQMFSISKIMTQAAARRARRANNPEQQLAAGAEGPESKDFYPSRSGTSTSGTVSHRDLCSVILRDTLRMYGIPREWIGIEVLKLSKSADTVQLQINFVIQYWHEGLLMYAPSLQKQFLHSLQSFDPGTDHSRHSVCWKFSAKCHCPFTEIPGPSYWAIPLHQFEDALSDPITLPPRHTDINQASPSAAGTTPLPPPAIDPAETIQTPFRFDLPPRDQEREHFGEFPSTIPLGIEKLQ
jgi:hypothetical protein